MKRCRCFLAMIFLVACLSALCISASAFDTRDLTPPSSAEYIVYGMSGAGRDLRAYKFGNGKNVLVVGFAIHGYEDNFEKDGGALVYTANQLMKTLDKNRDLISDYGWTIYVLPCMNPDGLIDGYTCNGPGRCTTSWIDTDGSLHYDTGIDLNRSFPLNWTHYSGSRYNNGPKPLAAMEARALADFVQEVKGNGTNLCIDVHGWFQQIITSNGQDSKLFQIFKSRFPNNTYANCSQSQGYFTSYAASLGYAACLFEFPWDVYSFSGFVNSSYCSKFCGCILDLLSAYGTYNGHSTVCPSHQFTDVVPWAWFHEAVDYAVDAKLFNGVSSDRFAPNSKMTRAMLVTTLWRMSGGQSAAVLRAKPETTSDLQLSGEIEDAENDDPEEEPEELEVLSFSDVVPGAWYEEAVYWAASHGIITGYPENTFRPNAPLTREQLATIMYRYSVWIGRSVDTASDLSRFPDANKVSSYAYAPMCWACGTGLINGVSGSGSGTMLSPGGTATRAQMATILMRYFDGQGKAQYRKLPEILTIQGAAEVEPNIDEDFGDLGGN